MMFIGNETLQSIGLSWNISFAHLSSFIGTYTLGERSGYSYPKGGTRNHNLPHNSETRSRDVDRIFTGHVRD